MNSGSEVVAPRGRNVAIGSGLLGRCRRRRRRPLILGKQQISHGLALDCQEDSSRHGVSREDASLSPKGTLVAKQLSRADPCNGLIGAVALGADLDFALDDNVILAGSVAGPEDHLAGFECPLIETGRDSATIGSLGGAFEAEHSLGDLGC